MEKSTATATQVTEPPTSSLPLPSAAVHKSSPAMDLDNSPAITTTDPSSRGRKRALEGNLHIENSNYYKMRLLLKDIRPHILEVLRTPDLRNCKAATEIQEKMKLMLQLYKELIGETPKREKTLKSESLTNGKAINQRPETSEKQSSEVGETVVGGSAFGWNFITYGGSEAVYHGMSKEEYRSSHPIVQAELEVELQKPL